MYIKSPIFSAVNIYTCILFAVITFLHLFKAPDVPEEVKIFPGLDKIAHLMMFSLAGLTLRRALVFQGGKKFFVDTSSLVFLITYALLMEILQDRLTQYRSFEWGDFSADVLGIFLGIWLSTKRILPFFFEHQVWKTS